MSEYTPTEARLRERAKGSLEEYAHEFGIDGEAAMDEWIDQALAERDNRVRADERAKRPDRIEELEKNLSYEVEQKIKLADTLRDERAKRPDREQIATIIADGVNTLTAEQLRELFIDPVAIANDVFAAFEGGRDV